eukprot:scaffold6017_cov160-Amphora_coffeaeformis.AAC.4
MFSGPWFSEADRSSCGSTDRAEITKVLKATERCAVDMERVSLVECTFRHLHKRHVSSKNPSKICRYRVCALLVARLANTPSALLFACVAHASRVRDRVTLRAKAKASLPIGMFHLLPGCNRGYGMVPYALVWCVWYGTGTIPTTVS